jgi:hypothetical protein
MGRRLIPNENSQIYQCPQSEAQFMLNTNEGIRLKDSTSRAIRILDANYEAADLKQVTEDIKTISPANQRELFNLLKTFEHLFDGTLCDFNTTPVSIELMPNTKPYHARPYPVPFIHKENVRKEVQRLCDAGVLKKCNDSAHAAPTLIIAKKIRDCQGRLRLPTPKC